MSRAAISNIFDLSGQTAMITGGGTGLGRQFATILAQAGAKVVLAHVNVVGAVFWIAFSTGKKVID